MSTRRMFWLTRSCYARRTESGTSASSQTGVMEKGSVGRVTQPGLSLSAEESFGLREDLEAYSPLAARAARLVPPVSAITEVERKGSVPRPSEMAVGVVGEGHATKQC